MSFIFAAHDLLEVNPWSQGFEKLTCA